MLHSVIVTTYNREEEIKRTLSSLVDQTYKDFEVLIIDDGSTDNTREIVDGFRDKLVLQYFFRKTGEVQREEEILEQRWPKGSG